MKVLELENVDLTWKSIIFNMPQGVLKFAVNAAIDSLPSNKNLYRWGKRMNDQCNLCQAKGTLHHILNNCDKMLDRYLWRHNSILRSLLMSIKPDLLDGQQVFADLEGETINGGTIPPTVIPTQQKPDLCFIDSNKKDIILIELTVPFETNIQEAHTRKQDRYATLIRDITKAGWNPVELCIEVGARGLITPENKKRLMDMIRLCKCKVKYPGLRDSIVKNVLFGSYVIFYSRSEHVWKSQKYLEV